MSARVDQDTIHCAALRAQKSTQARLSPPRSNVSHLIRRGAAFRAVSWTHHRMWRLDGPNGFPAGSHATPTSFLGGILDVEASHLAVSKSEDVSNRLVLQPVCLALKGLAFKIVDGLPNLYHDCVVSSPVEA